MFPNNVESFVREKEIERQAEVEQIRQGRLLNHKSTAGRRHMAHMLYWLGTRLIAWAAKLQVQPIPPPTSIDR